MTHALDREPGTRRRAVGWGLVALGLVTIVAMEANGAAWSTHRGTGAHSLPHGVVVAGGVCALLVAIVIFVALLLNTRVVETPEQRRKRWTNAILFLTVIALISIVRVLVHPSHAARKIRPTTTANGQPATSSGSGNPHGSDTWWPLVIVGLGTAAALVTAVVRRPGAGPTTDTDADDATIAVLDASLDDLRREPDPRRAVVAAYARMERGLEARGYARRPWETPSEYLHRALSGNERATNGRPPGLDEPLGARAPVADALRVLTALAEWARFSTRAVDETMRSRAIDALETLRRELRREVPREDVADLSRIT